jgi:hypothetical protein
MRLRVCDVDFLGITMDKIESTQPEVYHGITGSRKYGRMAVRRSDLPTTLNWSLVQEDLTDISSVFRSLCANGALVEAQWLWGARQHDITLSDDILWAVCFDGRLDVAKWLHKVCGVTKEHALYANCLTYMDVWGNGHRETFKWLEHTFGSLAIQIREPTCQ